ncbi:MAG: hypothetical protein P4L69_20185 [Desulfosporosinus sp.]|nr:hypothetical protein [Desulfosporosinus sp.]
MNEKPILFSIEMVKEILAGRKMKTRRVVKHQPPLNNSFVHGRVISSTEPKNEGCVGWGSNEGCITHYCKMPYDVGDVLWVRETWRPKGAWSGSCRGCEIEYRAGGENEIIHGEVMAVPSRKTPWKPSILMPRAFARLFLKVKGIRVERLQDITEEDARNEGCFLPSHSVEDGTLIGDSVTMFKIIWNNLNAKRGFGWDVNPWVWVVEFEKMEAEKDVQSNMQSV